MEPPDGNVSLVAPGMDRPELAGICAEDPLEADVAGGWDVAPDVVSVIRGETDVRGDEDAAAAAALLAPHAGSLDTT